MLRICPFRKGIRSDLLLQVQSLSPEELNMTGHFCILVEHVDVYEKLTVF